MQRSESNAHRAPAELTTVLLADDHSVVRMGVEGLLEVERDIQVIGQAESCDECCERAVRLRPDVIVLDLEMGDCRGIDALRRLLELCPGAGVVIFSSHEGGLLVSETLDAGAMGFVPKTAPPSRLVDAVRAVSRGEFYLDSSVASAVLGARSMNRRGRATSFGSLTDREKDVLALLAQGKRNKEISRALFISERTVKFHVSALMEKLDATNRTEAVKNAIDQGLIGS